MNPLNFLDVFILSFVLAVGHVAPSTAQAPTPPAYSCEASAAYGVPTGKSDVRQLCRQAYGVLHYGACRRPELVFSKLSVAQFGDETRAGMVFKPDTELPSNERALKIDYARTGFDEGHLFPAADATSSNEIMRQSFLFSNAVPQEPRHNRGIWRNLELRVRSVAKATDVYVITGATRTAGAPTKAVEEGAPPNGFYAINPGCIPPAMYKAIFNLKTGGSIAYLIPNDESAVSQPIRSFELPVAELEKLVGINFTPSNDKLLKTSVDEDLKKAISR